MSGSLESVRWNACVHRLDLGSYSHPKEFWGNEVKTHVNSEGKIPSIGDSEEDKLPTTDRLVGVRPENGRSGARVPLTTGFFRVESYQ